MLGALLLAGGIVVAKMPPSSRSAVDENRMETLAPASVQQCVYLPGDEDPGQSYKMGKETYDTLDPSGIVARLYNVGGKTYDVVVIASDSSKSFHDPRVCFTASGWSITKESEVQLKTKTRGIVPMTFVKMSGAGMMERSAIYGYRSPNGFVAQARAMRWEMFIGQVLKARNDMGVFYRFIPQSGDISDQELTDFAASYLDEANQASKGFF